MSDAGLRALGRRATALESLNVFACGRVTDLGVLAVARGAGRSLGALNLRGIEELTDVSAAAIAEHCPAIERLDLSVALMPLIYNFAVNINNNDDNYNTDPNYNKNVICYDDHNNEHDSNNNNDDNHNFIGNARDCKVWAEVCYIPKLHRIAVNFASSWIH